LCSDAQNLKGHSLGKSFWDYPLKWSIRSELKEGFPDVKPIHLLCKNSQLCGSKILSLSNFSFNVALCHFYMHHLLFARLHEMVRFRWELSMWINVFSTISETSKILLRLTNSRLQMVSAKANCHKPNSKIRVCGNSHDAVQHWRRVLAVRIQIIWALVWWTVKTPHYCVLHTNFAAVQLWFLQIRWTHVTIFHPT
jgi:hypothetical protein